MQKLLQKRVYDLLSHKYGVITVIVGAFLCLISAFHFGEAVFEWSKEKYTAVFNSYSDNIAGRSFRNRLCMPVPIDVVYTWVNGSDIKLKADLHLYKAKMEHQLNMTKDTTCQFSHCLPVNMLIVEPALPPNVTRDILRVLLPTFPPPASILPFKYSSHVNENYSVVAFHTENQVRRASNVSMTVFGLTHKTTRAYITSDHSVLPGVLLKDRVIMSGFPHRYDTTELKERLPLRFWKAITRVDLYRDEGLAVFHINNASLLESLVQKPNNITIDGKSPSFTYPNLIWHLSPLLDDDATKLSRFEDNELLRYSLRSLELYAPWVRNIYLVTNGQIPSWLNLENERLIVVSHQDIFPNSSHLPSYSSPAIESHLHRIPGLSRQYLYLNDDVLLGSQVWPDDFYTHARGHKVYLTWAVPNCQEGCPSSWVKDGYCDKACNNSHCEWDGGDCSGQNAGNGRSYGDFRDNFRQNFGPISERLYCFGGCADNWLADKYCDQTCNHVECGFDAGDCGTRNYNQLYTLTLDQLKNTYTLPQGTTRMYFNLSSLLADSDSITEASHERSPVVRVAAVGLSFQVLTLVLHTGHNTSTIPFCLRGFRDSDMKDKYEYNFTVTVSTIAATNTTSVDVVSSSHDYLSNPRRDTPIKHPLNTTTIADEPIVFADVPQHLRYPKGSYHALYNETVPPVNISHDLPPDLQQKWQSLLDEYNNGDLTEKGLKIQQHTLVEEFKSINRTTLYMTRFQVPQNSNRLDKTTLYSTRFQVPQNSNKLDKTTSHHIPTHTNRQLLSLKLNIHKNDDKEVRMDTNSRPQSSTIKRTGSLKYSRLREDRGLPWEKIGFFDTIEKRLYHTALLRTPHHHQSRKLLGAYEDSLLHVNRIYNREFGYTARKVPGHIAHFIDKSIMEQLQAAFPREWVETSSHHIRSSADMQFSFSYFYYLMSVKANITVDEVFTNMDTDKSGVLSDREIRTMATQLFDSPLDLASLTKLENILVNCKNTSTPTEPQNPASRELYYAKDMTQVTRSLFTNCSEIVKLVRTRFTTKHKYKFEIENDQHIAFKMLPSNVSILVGQLDDIRRNRRKFICLNDNMDHTVAEARTAQAVVVDFLEALYPRPSQFELAHDYRNRFLHIDELREWQVYRDRLRFWAHVALVILILVTCLSFFSEKIESLSRRLSRRSSTSSRRDAIVSV